jgi:hypothetical protein
MTPGGPANEAGCSAKHGGLRRRAASVWFPLLQRGAARTEMGKIVVSENVTLDEVIQDPAGGKGLWANPDLRRCTYA